MKFKWSKRLTIALLSLLLIGSAILFKPKKTSYSSKALSQISHEERYFLSTFFRCLLFSDNFSYLLFGSKPVAATGFEKTTSFWFSRHWLSALDTEINIGLGIFKKYQHLFSSGNIIVHLDEDADGQFVLMINKKNLLKTLNEHINDFKKVLGPETTVESLYARITRRDEYLFDVIQCHEALYGILLGFGRDNAWQFYDKRAAHCRSSHFEIPKKFNGSLYDEFSETDKTLTFFSDDPHECKFILKSPRLPLPHFMADPNSLETKMLKERYGKEREEMKRLFNEKGFVEATLQKLMDE